MALTKWLAPTHRHALTTNQGRVSWLELFFDLVYVAALIQLGDELADDISWGGVGRFVAVFALLWWTWTGTTAYTNRFAVDDITHRVLVFVQMFAVANVALLAVGPNENRWTWLAVAYLGARIPFLIMYARILRLGGDAGGHARISLGALSVGASLWAVSIALPEPLRFVVWGLAVVIEFAAPIAMTTRNVASPTMHEHHLRERYAVFTIIVFGETFVKTLTKLAERGVSVESQVFGGLIFLGAVALWWTYFDDIADSDIRHHNGLFRVGWVYMHLPLAAALTAFGVGSKKIVAIEQFGDPIKGSYLWLFGGSIAVALVATAVLDALTVSPHFAINARLRIGAPLVAALAVIAVVALLDSPALLVCALIAVLVVGQIGVEVVSAARADRAVAERMDSEFESAAQGCEDLARTAALQPPPHAACALCVEAEKPWVELRQCQSCGYIGCCDDSEGRHATTHWEESGHRVIATIEEGGTWAYCYEHTAIDDPWSVGNDSVRHS